MPQDSRKRRPDGTEASRHELSMRLPDDSVYVDADVTRLSQVFANLLNNAAKFTPLGGPIEIRTSATDQQTVVSIRDNGIGIPQEMLPKVFDMFTSPRPRMPAIPAQA